MSLIPFTANRQDAKVAKAENSIRSLGGLGALAVGIPAFLLALNACAATPPAASPPATDTPPAAVTETPSSPAAPAPAAAAPTEAGPKLELTLTVRPKPILTVAESKEFRLDLDVKNPGTSPVAPNLESSTLFVNDKPFKPWNDALSLGPKNDQWTQLLPGRTLTFSFVFSKKQPVKPGDYRFVLKLGPNTSQPVDAHIGD